MSIRSRIAWAASVSCLAALVLSIRSPATAADAPATKTIKADDLTLKVPEAWQAEKVSSNFRKAQMKVPKVEGDKEGADFVVYFFEGGGGGVEANIQRWVGQFQSKDRKVKVSSGKSPQGDYVLVDLRGTWNKPIGPMVQQRTKEMPESRAISLILTTKEGNYYLRLTGPEKTVSANGDALRTAIGAEAKSEKERPLTRE
jgi:gluconolactonase